MAKHVDLHSSPHSCSFQAPDRYSLDTHVDNFGHSLLQFCQASQLHILNGRMPGNVPAQFTSHANAGHTCVDYFIASPGIPCRAVKLAVQDTVPFLTHFHVSLTIEVPFPAVSDGESHTKSLLI